MLEKNIKGIPLLIYPREFPLRAKQNAKRIYVLSKFVRLHMNKFYATGDSEMHVVVTLIFTLITRLKAHVLISGFNDFQHEN